MVPTGGQPVLGIDHAASSEAYFMNNDFRAGLWSQADFVLRGEYCPPTEVLAHLERTRQALGADVLIHLAFDHEYIMRSLSWAVGARAELVDNISEWIRFADYKNRNREINNKFVKDASEFQSESQHVLSPSAAAGFAGQLSAIEYKADRRVLSAEARSLLDGEWTGFALNHTGRNDVLPWDGEVRSILLLPAVTKVGPDANDALQDLGVRLKCTAEANARRDSVVMGQVMQDLTFTSGDEDSSLESMSEKALKLACQVTGSIGGAIYYLSTSPREFWSAATVDGDDHAYPPTLPYENRDSPVRWAVERHRAYQQIVGSSASRALVRAVTATGGTELITPIAGPLANTSSPAVGAIALFHHPDNPRGYTAYERALVRNIALRLALFRTNVATRRIANAIATLRASSPSRTPLTATAQVADLPERPRDIIIATERFEKPLSEIADSTDSHSVTLRIALPDPDSPSPHGLSLHRVAAFPPARMMDDYPIEHRGDPGLHWDVFESGRELYVPDAKRDQKHFRKEIRENTRSVLCVPVKVDGILVGTLNLESTTVDNYAPYLPLMIALSGAIGRTLADARAEIEGGLLDRAAQALAQHHELGGNLKEIEDELTALKPVRSRNSIVAKIVRLQSTVVDLRSTGSSPTTTVRARTLWEIVEECAQRTQLSIQKDRPADTLFHERLTDQASHCIATALDCIFRNINDHSSPDGRDSAGRLVPRIRFTTGLLQGTTQAVLRIENLAREFLDQRFCAELYRYPSEGTQREIRLGTHIAAIHARRIGGRVHASVPAAGRIVRTTMIIPVGELRADH